MEKIIKYSYLISKIGTFFDNFGVGTAAKVGRNKDVLHETT
jgi:hypothetical protein